MTVLGATSLHMAYIFYIICNIYIYISTIIWGQYLFGSPTVLANCDIFFGYLNPAFSGPLGLNPVPLQADKVIYQQLQKTIVGPAAGGIVFRRKHCVEKACCEGVPGMDQWYNHQRSV